MKTLQEPKKSNMMVDGPMERMLPSFSINEKQLPDIKNWKVGEKYEMEIEVEMTSISKSQYRTGEPITASLKVTKIGVTDTEDEATKEAKKGHD